MVMVRPALVGLLDEQFEVVARSLGRGVFASHHFQLGGGCCSAICCAGLGTVPCWFDASTWRVFARPCRSWCHRWSGHGGIHQSNFPRSQTDGVGHGAGLFDASLGPDASGLPGPIPQFPPVATQTPLTLGATQQSAAFNAATRPIRISNTPVTAWPDPPTGTAACCSTTRPCSTNCWPP